MDTTQAKVLFLQLSDCMQDSLLRQVDKYARRRDVSAMPAYDRAQAIRRAFLAKANSCMRVEVYGAALYATEPIC